MTAKDRRDCLTEPVKHACIIACAVVLALGCRRAEAKQPVPQQPQASQPVLVATPQPALHEANEEAKWATVEEFNYRWQPDQPVHFKLERPENKHIDADFTRIHIHVKGQSDFVLDSDYGDGWMKYNNPDEPSKAFARLQEQNLVSSRYVLVVASSLEKGDPPLVLLRTSGVASDTDLLHVISFQPSGKPTVILKTNLDLRELADLDGDGRPEIVGYPCMSEEFGNGLQTYDPIGSL